MGDSGGEEGPSSLVVLHMYGQAKKKQGAAQERISTSCHAITNEKAAQ